MHTNANQGRVLIRLPDDSDLGRELRTYLQTESYVKTKHTGSLPDTTKRILRDRSEDNRGRRSRIVGSLREMLAGATYFASGKKLNIRSSAPKEALSESLEYLIKNAYPKMGYIAHLQPNPKQEIQSMLRADDVEQVTLALNTPEANTKALDDMREYVRLCAQTSKQVVLRDMIEKRYGQRPYGWPDLEVVLLVARLAVLKEITLVVNAAPLPLDKAYDHLTSSSKQRKVIINQRKVAGKGTIKKAQELGKELFGQLGPAAEDTLFVFLKGRLEAWNEELGHYNPLAKTGDYPGVSEIEDGLLTLRKFVEESDSLRFLERFNENRTELLDLSEDHHDLKGFYTNQKHSWENLRKAVQALSQNRLQLESHPEAAPALKRMEEILGHKTPYNMLHEVAALTHTATTVNDALVAEHRIPAATGIQGLLDGVNDELDKVSADAGLRRTATTELGNLLTTAKTATSIAHIAQARETAEAAFDRALTAIEAAMTPPPPEPDTPSPAPTPKPQVKKRRVVEAKGLWPVGFIETQADVDGFLGKLRAELEDALEAGERIQIK